jgi:hypothetical protein
LSAQVTVLANGNQRFVVPVTLTITPAAFDFSRLITEPAPTPAPFAVPVALPGTPPPGTPEAIPVPALPAEVTVADVAAAEPTAPVRAGIAWKHLLPAAVLLLVQGCLLGYDALSKPARPGAAPPPKNLLGLDYGDLRDANPRLEFAPNPNGNLRFGLVMTRERDPKEAGKFKRLTYDENGRSNNTCVKIDGAEYLFGMRPGRLVSDRTQPERHAWKSEWAYDEGVRVTQVVQIVPGEQTGVLDTCLVRYAVRNESHEPHRVGLRAMLDSFIGAEDGVPFAIPGRGRLLTTPQEFREKEIPDFIQALERPDFNDPGTVAHVGLKGLQLPGAALDPIVRVMVCQYPNNPNQKWDFDLKEVGRDGGTIDDSCLVLYWAEAPMNPGETREMAFSYGLNAISAAEGGESPLALTAGGSFQTGGEFTVTAYVRRPRSGQKVTLHLPAGLELGEGEAAEKAVEEATEYTPVSWRVRSTQEGTYELSAATGPARAAYSVRITNRGLFR